MALNDLKEHSGFFKPAEHKDDVAIIFEPLDVKEDVDSQYGKRDEVRTRVTIFRSSEALDKGKPSSIETVIVTTAAISRKLKELFNDAKSEGDDHPATIAVVGTAPSKKGRDAWVLKTPKETDKTKASAYYSKREAARVAPPSYDED